MVLVLIVVTVGCEWLQLDAIFETAEIVLNEQDSLRHLVERASQRTGYDWFFLLSRTASWFRAKYWVEALPERALCAAQLFKRKVKPADGAWNFSFLLDDWLVTKCVCQLG